MSIRIKRLAFVDAEQISRAFSRIGWNKPAAQYETYVVADDDLVLHLVKRLRKRT